MTSIRKFIYALFLVMVVLPISAAIQTAAQEATPTPLPDPCAAAGSNDQQLGFHIGRGDSFFLQGDLTRAIEAYTCAIQFDPSYVPAYVNRGYANAAQRNDLAALDDYNKALELDPSSVAAYNNRGLLYLSQGRFQQAYDDFEQVVSLAPDSPIGYHNRAIVNASEGFYDFALEDLAQAITLDPNFSEAYATRGAVYLALASIDYQTYNDQQGYDANAQTGNSATMLRGIDNDVRNEGFGVWLPLLVPLGAPTP